MREEKIVLPCSLMGKVISKEEEYVEIEELSNNDFENLLKEVAKFDYKFNRGHDMISIEAKIDGRAMFVEISHSEYKSMCDMFFKSKLENIEREI